MINQKLEKANTIQKEIEELDQFINVSERVWTGKLIKRTSKYIFQSSPYGIYDEAEYQMDTTIKNKVLDVLRDKLEELQKDLSQYIK